MKKFVAYVPGSSHNSGEPKTREKALEWAKNHFAVTSKSSTKVYLCEVTDIVGPTTPPIEVTPFVPAEDPVSELPLGVQQAA